MQGLDGWTYPYQATLIDDQAGMIIGFWKQVADAKRPDGTHVRGRGLRLQLVRLRATARGSGSATSSTT